MEDRSILEKKSLGDLRYIAKMLGLKSIYKYRKGQLIDYIIDSAKDNKLDLQKEKRCLWLLKPMRMNRPIPMRRGPRV